MNDDYGKMIMKALAEIRRHQVLVTKLAPETKEMYSDAYAYAILHRICPIFEEEHKLKTDRSEILDLLPFHETYDVGYEQVEEIANLLDAKWGSEKLTFYDVEGPYKLGRTPWNGLDPRGDLINICRYFYLSRRFDTEFWQEFMSNAPSEASSVLDEWDPQEIIDWTNTPRY